MDFGDCFVVLGEFSARVQEQLQKKREEDIAKETALKKKLEEIKKKVAEHMKMTGSSNDDSSPDELKNYIEERDAVQEELDKFMKERKIFSDEACKVVNNSSLLSK